MTVSLSCSVQFSKRLTTEKDVLDELDFTRFKILRWISVGYSILQQSAQHNWDTDKGTQVRPKCGTDFKEILALFFRPRDILVIKASDSYVFVFVHFFINFSHNFLGQG